MQWKDIVNQVRTTYSPCYQKKQKPPSPSKHYYLGPSFGGLYFTSREAETMVYLLLGKTVNATAQLMKLSPRTIEFYVNNMKKKLACRTKAELIQRVVKSEFLKKERSHESDIL